MEVACPLLLINVAWVAFSLAPEESLRTIGAVVVATFVAPDAGLDEATNDATTGALIAPMAVVGPDTAVAIAADILVELSVTADARIDSVVG